jgi:predicted transcriptional regulator of viral defense system
VAKSLHNALPTLDLVVLVEYANRMGDRSLGSRLGFLLEERGYPVGDLSKSATPVKLDPGRNPDGPLSARWRVIINVPVTEVFPAGIG